MSEIFREVRKGEVFSADLGTTGYMPDRVEFSSTEGPTTTAFVGDGRNFVSSEEESRTGNQMITREELEKIAEGNKAVLSTSVSVASGITAANYYSLYVPIFLGTGKYLAYTFIFGGIATATLVAAIVFGVRWYLKKRKLNK